MSKAQPQHRLTADAYLEWEAEQTERHEFVQGEVFAMSGGTQNHNAVGGNVYLALRQHLRGTPCRVYISDMRVKLLVDNEDAYVYPDVVVSCQPQQGRALTVDAPVLVVEVLSDSTAVWDRSGKFAAYRGLPSLQEYLLIDPEAATLELYRRNAAGRFELFTWNLSERCEFASVGLQLPVAELFDGVEFPVARDAKPTSPPSPG